MASPSRGDADAVGRGRRAGPPFGRRGPGGAPQRVAVGPEPVLTHLPDGLDRRRLVGEDHVGGVDEVVEQTAEAGREHVFGKVREPPDGPAGLQRCLHALVAVPPHPPRALTGSATHRRGHASGGGDPVRVVIAEDEALLREGIALMLQRAGIDVIGVTASAPISCASPTWKLPTSDDGLRAALAVRAARAETAVVVLFQYVQRRYALELLEDRPTGVGYLLKQRIANAESFCRDVRRVAEGETVLDPKVVSRRCSPGPGTTRTRSTA